MRKWISHHFRKKNFLSWHMKIHQGGSIDKKNFFLLEMNIEDEKMDFPPFSKKKKIFKLAHENPSRGSIDKKNFFLLEMNIEDEKMDFLEKKKFFKLAHENSSRGSIAKKIFFLLKMNITWRVDLLISNF